MNLRYRSLFSLVLQRYYYKWKKKVLGQQIPLKKGQRILFGVMYLKWYFNMSLTNKKKYGMTNANKLRTKLSRADKPIP